MRRAEIKTILLEALAVAVAGSAFAFAANLISPRGLALGRDYFPAGVSTASSSTNLSPATPTTPGAENAGRLAAKGLHGIPRDEAAALQRDQRFQRGAIIFVDARDEEKYQAGHIPGAWQLDFYHPERQFGTVFPLCQAAERVVVYCTGGDCEDAESTALMLRDAGVAPDHLWVYAGGMDDWKSHHLPVETGNRLSGNITPGSP